MKHLLYAAAIFFGLLAGSYAATVGEDPSSRWGLRIDRVDEPEITPLAVVCDQLDTGGGCVPVSVLASDDAKAAAEWTGYRMRGSFASPLPALPGDEVVKYAGVAWQDQGPGAGIQGTQAGYLQLRTGPTWGNPESAEAYWAMAVGGPTDRTMRERLQIYYHRVQVADVPMEVTHGPGDIADVIARRTDTGVIMSMHADGAVGFMGTRSNHPARLMVGNNALMDFRTDYTLVLRTSPAGCDVAPSSTLGVVFCAGPDGSLVVIGGAGTHTVLAVP